MIDYELAIIGNLISNNDEESIKQITSSLKEEMFENEECRCVFSSIKDGMRGVEVIIDHYQNAYPNIANTIRASLSSRYFEDSVPISEAIKTTKNKYLIKQVGDINGKYTLDEHNAENVLRRMASEISSILPVDDKHMTHASDLPQKFKNKYFVDKPDPFNLGFGRIDELIGGIDKGSFVVIAARPSIGKSALVLQVLRTHKNFKGGYFNLEMSENQIFERLMAAESGIDLSRIRRAKAFLGDEEIKFNSAIKKMEDYKFDIISGRALDVTSVRKYCLDHKYDYIVVDYLQLLGSELKGRTRNEEVTSISRGLRLMALELNIVVIALSQLNRASGDGIDKEPSMSEIRDSGSIEQDATEIVMMWGSKDRDIKNIKLEKARMGTPGNTQLVFNGKYMTFADIESKENPFTQKEEDNKKPKSKFEEMGFMDISGEIPFD